MNLKALSVAVAWALSGVASGQQVAPIPHQSVPEFIGYVQDEFIVQFEPLSSQRLTASQAPDGSPRVNIASLQTLISEHRIQAVSRQFQSATPQPANSPYPDLTGYYKIKMLPGADLNLAVQAFEADPNVDHVEMIGIHSLYNTPNDTYYQNSPNPNFPYDQWHYWDSNGIDADLAWDAQTGDQNVLVGMLDSGVRYFHIDLGGNSAQWGPGNPFSGGNVFINPGETPGNGTDDDNNGFTDDTIGWDFVTSGGGGGVSCIDQDCSGADNDPDDGDGHGSHTAGTVGAITNNGILVAGVAGGFSDGTQSGTGNGVKVIPLRIGYHARYRGQTTGIVRMDWAAEAMNYVSGLVDDGHNVAAINCSWGSSNSGGLNAAVDNLLAHDVMIVHAAGNSGSSTADFLGNKAGVMNVAATDINGNGASFTNHGSWVDVAAPGVDIVSISRNPDDPDPAAHYISLLSGTSMSAPHICGIAALLESCTPSLSGPDKFNLIVNNTQPYSDSRDLGSGIANAKDALDASNCTGTPCDITASFSASNTSGCAPLVVAFTDTSTGTGINGWAWSFGDGNTSTAQNPSHSYAAAGDYTVSLTASSATCQDSVTQTALVSVSEVPVADFSADTTSGNAPLSVNFSDLSSGNPNGWSWTFGDGGTATSQNPSHTYSSVGTYTVILTASNGCGSDGETKVDYITVTQQTGPTDAYVSDIVVSKVNLGGGNKQGRAVVTILDNNNNPVVGASVIGDFTGKTTDLGFSAVTNASGQATVLSNPARGGGEWCFEVTDVTSSLNYDVNSAPFNNVTMSCEGGDVF